MHSAVIIQVPLHGPSVNKGHLWMLDGEDLVKATEMVHYALSNRYTTLLTDVSLF